MEQLNYQPVSFQGIVPQLDVGDPSQSFVASMQGAVAGEQANLQQMARNAQVENMNLKTKLDGLQSLAQISGKAYETYVNISNQNLKNRLAEKFAQGQKDGYENYRNIDIKPYEQDEKEASDAQQQVGEATAVEVNSDKEPDVQKIAAAGQLRNSIGLDEIVYRNGLTQAALLSYRPALENWVSKIPNLQPDKYNDMVDEFNRRWGASTGLALANEQFLAKYVHPEINKQIIQHKDQFTRQWNASHADKQTVILQQRLKNGEITPSSFFLQITGLTKSDGKTLKTYEDGWEALSQAELTETELEKIGNDPFKLTGKPYSAHPRFQRLIREARNRRITADTLRRKEQDILSRDGFSDVDSLASGAAERDRQLAIGVDPDIVESNYNTFRRRSSEAVEIREWTDKINIWLNNNPDKKIPYDVIADAPFQVKQQFKGQMEPDANAATTEELIRDSDQFKALTKDMEATMVKVAGQDVIKLSDLATGGVGPTNLHSYKSEALTNIAQRAQVLMLGEEGMNLQDALTTAKQEWVENAKALNEQGKYFDKNTNSFVQQRANVGLTQATRMMAQQLEQTTLQDLSKGLYESDYTQPPVQGRYSERVRFLARRYGMRPKEIVDTARQQQGLPALNSTPVDDILGMVDPVMDRRINSLDTSSATAAIRAQIRSNQRLSGSAKDRTIAVGQQLLTLGITGIWQHPDFEYHSGFTGSGKERVMPRSGGYHPRNEALDIGLNGNGKRKLDLVYAYLLKNKERFGIAELIWDPYNLRKDNHDTHVHVSFE